MTTFQRTPTQDAISYLGVRILDLSLLADTYEDAEDPDAADWTREVASEIQRASAFLRDGR
jgi:hypothetical protein